MHDIEIGQKFENSPPNYRVRDENLNDVHVHLRTFETRNNNAQKNT